jgi:3-hydroxypropanoate dehydrogenase
MEIPMAAEKRVQQELDDKSLDVILREARTHSVWQDKDVPDSLLKEIIDTMKWGPTSANTCPARFIFVKSKEAKKRLEPLMDEGNREKTMKAPATAIIAYDLKFYEKTDKLAPHNPKVIRSWFEGKPVKIQDTAYRNGTLQGGYFILAARALGLDCGPMSGFDMEGIKKEFFPNEDWMPNFLCNLGYGDASKLHPRAPRLSFDESAQII